MPIPQNISASRGAAILTYYDEELQATRPLSKWQTPISVWLQIMESRDPGFCAKNKFELPVFEDSAPIRWGNAFESAIIDLAKSKCNNAILNREELCRYYNADFITCHIDGAYKDYYFNEKIILHEGKTTTAFYFYDNFGDPGTDRVPIEYQIQCQHQMICTGAEKVILSVLVFPKRQSEFEEMGWTVEKYNNDVYRLFRKIDGDAHENWSPIKWAQTLDEMGFFHQYEITADPELQARMIADYSDWWEKYVIGKTPPPPTHYSDIKSLLTAPVGTIVATTEIENLMSERKQIQSEIKGTGPLAKRSEAIKVQVLDFMRLHGADAVDDDSVDKMILRDSTGKKLFSYGKNKNGALYSR